MKFRKTILLACVLFVAVYFVFQVLLKQEAQQAAEKFSFSDIQIEDLQSISIQNQKGVINFKRYEVTSESFCEQARAFLFEFASKPGIKVAVEKLKALIHLVAKLNLDQKIPTRRLAADLSVYGLRNPHVALVLNFKSSDNLVLSFGSKNEYMDLRYMMVSGFSGIYAVEDDLFKLLLDNAGAYREKDLFSIKTENFREVSIIRSDSEMILKRVAETSWQVNDKAADLVFVQELLRTISTLKAVGFPRKLQDYGFLKPRLKLMLKYVCPGDNENMQQDVLIIGNQTIEKAKESKFFAQIQSFPAPFFIDEKSYKKIDLREEVFQVRAP